MALFFALCGRDAALGLALVSRGWILRGLAMCCMKRRLQKL